MGAGSSVEALLEMASSEIAAEDQHLMDDDTQAKFTMLLPSRYTFTTNTDAVAATEHQSYNNNANNNTNNLNSDSDS